MLRALEKISRNEANMGKQATEKRKKKGDRGRKIISRKIWPRRFILRDEDFDVEYWRSW